MRKIVSCVVAMMLLASAVPLAITPAAAYEKKIPFAGEDSELTKDELVNVILPYMLEEGNLKLDDVGDASYVYAYWSGKPKRITDMAEREVTFYRPVERVFSPKVDATRIMVALDECNKVVGVTGVGSLCPGVSWKEPAEVCAEKVCGGRLLKLPEVSTKNMEFIVSPEPDVIFLTTDCATASGPLQKTGVPVVCVYTTYIPFLETSLYPMNEIIGKVVDKEEEAEELSSFVKETFDGVREITSQIPEEEKPKVYFASRGVSGSGWSEITRTIIHYEPLEIAGGINLADGSIPDPGTSTVDVSKEQVIAWNPDIILIACSGPATGGRERVLSDPDLQMVNAVKNERVYYCIYPYAQGLAHARNLVQVMYLAKLFHPEKFKDLDVEEEGNEIFKAFLRVDGLFSEYADYRNWMREWLDSQK